MDGFEVSDVCCNVSLFVVFLVQMDILLVHGHRDGDTKGSVLKYMVWGSQHQDFFVATPCIALQVGSRVPRRGLAGGVFNSGGVLHYLLFCITVINCGSNGENKL